MIFLIGFLCCLVNAAQPEHEYVAPKVMLVPMGVMPQPMLYGGNMFLFPKICYQPVICVEAMRDEVCVEADAPPTKRLRMQSEASSDEPLNARDLSSSQAQKDNTARKRRAQKKASSAAPLNVCERPRKVQNEVIEMDVSMAAVMQEVVAQTDDEARVRRADILEYLRSCAGRFVSEVDVQNLHQQSADEVLEDVVGLIAEKHNIQYKDKSYRLYADPICPSLDKQQLHRNLCAWVKEQKFQKYQSLSVAEQAYHIYAENDVYVPVSTMAVWIEMQKEKHHRGAAERRLALSVYLANKTLRAKSTFYPKDFDKTNLGPVRTNDLSLIKKSLDLYAQGREVVKNTRSGIRLPADEKYPEILHYLEKYKGRPVSEAVLQGLMTQALPNYRHRDLYRTIAKLRKQAHNITSAPAFGGKTWTFTLEEGVWLMQKGCYKKVLWQMLDDPQYAQLGATGLFLVLSNAHYNPDYSLVDEIVRCKRFLGGEEQGDYPEELRAMWNIAMRDRCLYDSIEYYRGALNTSTDILGPLFEKVKRRFSLYMQATQ